MRQASLDFLVFSMSKINKEIGSRVNPTRSKYCCHERKRAESHFQILIVFFQSRHMFISEKHFSGLKIINYFIMCSTVLVLPKISLCSDKNTAFELKNHFWPAPNVILLEKKRISCQVFMFS